MTRRLQLVLVGLFFALLFVYSGASIHRTFTAVGPSSDTGWVAEPVAGRVIISQVRRDGPAAALREGDEILALDGQPLRSISQILDIERSEPGRPYTITVRRDSQTAEVALRTGELNLGEPALLPAVLDVIKAIFLITGFAVFLLKPYDKQAVLLALMLGMFFAAPQATVPEGWPASMPLWLTAVTLAVHVASLFLWPVFFHFFLTFPETSPLLRRSPRLEYYLYLPHLVTIFPYFAIFNLLSAVAPDRAPQFLVDFWPLGLLSTLLFVLYIAGGLMSLMVNYRQAGRASRRKMRVVVAGSVAGFLPMSLWLGLVFLFDLQDTAPAFSRWLFIAAILAFPLFPLSFAYAIVRHRVIPVHLIIRRGVRYLLVSRGFIIVQALVVFALLSFLLTGSRMAAIDRLGNRADIVVTMIATAVAVALLTYINQRALPIIDRRFFREAYDAQQLLSELGQEMRTMATVGQLLELAVSKIQAALHTENVTIFLRSAASGDYVCAISSRHTDEGEITAEANRDLVLPRDGFITEKMAESSSPLAVELGEPSLWGQSHSQASKRAVEIRDKERSVLRRVRSTLLLPIAAKNDLLAIISLGPRLGDLPFSREDRQMLMAVAWQMAFAIQNVQLVQQVAEEERLRHELEIATAVQRRLFPQCAPEVGHLDLAGVCHPARGVGGDYYDFILLDGGNVGIAVADVAGKGISAALLMSTVQASLRSQAPTVNGRLTELVSSMNRLLHVSTDATSYATFFYAQFDGESGLLTYVNAGHNPPMLVRARPALSASQARRGGRDAAAVAAGVEAGSVHSQVRLITTGGLIIGAFQSCEYEQEAIEMYSGDLLVAYTDGVTEAFNSAGEEFGERRLRKIITESAHLSAQELSDTIVASVRQWCGDAPQHDDLTLVVMKVK
jgi:sigma-B regulation protein RsbU (phosphoserine phosphatase)